MTRTGEIIFGIDVDEVLRGLLDGMIKLYREHFDPDFKREDVKNFDVDLSFPLIKKKTGKSASDWFFRKFGHELFLNSDAIDNAASAVKELRQYGKVVLVTYQKSPDNKRDTLTWLEQNGFEYDGICFTKDKTFVHCDYFIDDNDWNFLGSNSRYGVLIDAPYNVDVNIDELIKQSNCENILKFKSISEFVKWFASFA